MPYYLDLAMLNLSANTDDATATEIARVLRARGFDVEFAADGAPADQVRPVPPREWEDVVELVTNPPKGGVYPAGWDRRVEFPVLAFVYTDEFLPGTIDYVGEEGASSGTYVVHVNGRWVATFEGPAFKGIPSTEQDSCATTLSHMASRAMKESSGSTT